MFMKFINKYSERYVPLSLEGRYHVIFRNHKTILKLIFNDSLNNFGDNRAALQC